MASSQSTESLPIKSALRKPDAPTIKRSVTFAPGLINKHGKSDIAEIDESISKTSDEKEEVNNDKLILNSDTSSNESLNFTNWRFGNQSFSGSETSDDEKDFGAMNEKYKSWSRQFVANQEREEKMKIIKKKTLKNLKKAKKNIKRLKSEVPKKEIVYGFSTETDNASSTTTDSNEKYKKWKKKQNKKGVIYIASVPFGCTSAQLKKIFNEFGQITNVYLEAAKGEKGQIKTINNRWTEFCEAWIEFANKKIAKQVVEILNETKIPKKYVKNRMARNHVWNMKYLKGFGWHHLNEYKETIKTLQRKKYEIKIADAQRQSEYFESMVHKARQITKGFDQSIGGLGSSEDEMNNYFDEPPRKKQKVVQQRSVRLRRNHQNRKMINKLLK